MKQDIYLDHGATTPVDPDVVHTMKAALEETYGNPSSLHRKGLESERKIDQAREIVAKGLGAKRSEIVFTSGGTEANNLAILGTARKYASRGKHLITSAVEHACVRDAMRHLETEGFRVTYLPVDRNGRVSVEDVSAALTDDTILVSIMYINNETGTIQPIDEIGKLLAEHRKTLFHVDAVQAFGKIPFNVKQLGIDLLGVSSHKIYGPKGVGALYIRQGVDPQPLVFGGGQERGIRSGTENVPGIIGFGVAAEKSSKKLQEHEKHLCQIRDSFLQLVEQAIPDIRVNSPHNESSSIVAPHVVNISFLGVKGEVLVHALESHGIYASTGSACSSKEKIYSPVLTAMGLTESALESAVRFSFGPMTTQEQIETAVDRLAECVEDLRLLTRR